MDQAVAPLMEFDRVSVDYNGKLALEELTFDVPPGARVAVVGPNGAGKSTLFKTLVGLLPLRSGSIRIHGLPVRSHKDCVAYVPQREDVEWRFPVTVQDVVMMGRYERIGWFGRAGRQDRAVVSGCLAQMGISDLARRSIAELSGGQQQRVFLARSLAQEPHILLMDEPFTSVDVSTQEATLDLLDELKNQGVTTMISTHDLSLASQRFDRLLLLNRRIIAYDQADRALTAPALREAFGSKLLVLPGEALVVDDCCTDNASEDVHIHPDTHHHTEIHAQTRR